MKKIRIVTECSNSDVFTDGLEVVSINTTDPLLLFLGSLFSPFLVHRQGENSSWQLLKRVIDGESKEPIKVDPPSEPLLPDVHTGIKDFNLPSR